MDIQKEFKDYALSKGWCIDGESTKSGYLFYNAQTNDRWIGWQAAKSQEREKLKLLLCCEHLGKCESKNGVFNTKHQGEEPCLICLLNEKKAQAKSQAVPEGFVLLEKKNLRDTYYLVDSEYVVDDPTEYELELECGEIATLEKWQRTKEVKVFCANIYSDEDNFEVVEFESIEDAEKAIAENKVMLEAQEQLNG